MLKGKNEPCPFCGGNRMSLATRQTHEGTRYFVVCHNCEARTGSSLDKREAIDKWNRRKDGTYCPACGRAEIENV